MLAVVTTASRRTCSLRTCAAQLRVPALHRRALQCTPHVQRLQEHAGVAAAAAKKLSKLMRQQRCALRHQRQDRSIERGARARGGPMCRNAVPEELAREQRLAAKVDDAGGKASLRSVSACLIRNVQLCIMKRRHICVEQRAAKGRSAT